MDSASNTTPYFPELLGPRNTTTMSTPPPRLNMSGLRSASPEETTATASPARGREMRTNVLSKLRPPPLVHSWDFWHDRQDRKGAGMGTSSGARNSQPNPQYNPGPPQNNDSDLVEPGRYEDRLVHLAEISDVKAFWSTFNNFDVTSMPLRDTVHLFHRGVKPVWEDPRNARGGSWTFRVPKSNAAEFWRELCMMAIGEQLQAAVASARTSFVDDICGVSLSIRFTSVLVQVWNRDAEHGEGVERILQVVQENLPPHLKLNESAYFYKRHNERAGFSAPRAREASTTTTNTSTETNTDTSTETDNDRTTTTAPPRRRSRDAAMAAAATRTEGATPDEVTAKMGAPGAKGQTVPKGDGMVSQAEALQDVENTLETMDDAMRKVEAKNEAQARGEMPEGVVRGKEGLGKEA